MSLKISQVVSDAVDSITHVSPRIAGKVKWEIEGFLWISPRLSSVHPPRWAVDAVDINNLSCVSFGFVTLEHLL